MLKRVYLLLTDKLLMSERPALMGLVYLLILAAPWLVWQAGTWSRAQAFDQLAREGHERVILYAGSLHSEIEKYQNIPLVLASDPEVVAMLAGKSDPQALSRRLERLNRKLEASAIYVMDVSGLTLSASNWAEGVGSFVGQRFDFRPYYIQAMQSGVGHYFALGTTSNQPGYYIAMPVRQDGRTLGAVVVKMSMAELEKSWVSSGERVFVTDSHGIVFITNHALWRYHSRLPLGPEDRLAVRASRQYGDEPLNPIGLVDGERLVTADGRGFLPITMPLEDGEGWTLTVLLDAGQAQDQARDTGLLVVAGLLLLGFGIYALAQRSMARRRQRLELERRVEERTAELTAKQDELVQAAKLAALGQMSAGMVHEINQPLAALRSYADNAVTYLKLGKPEGAAENLTEIADLTERMARITGQLKQFARKSQGLAEPVAVTRLVETSLALLGGRPKAEGVELVSSLGDSHLRVWGDEVRLQQVLVNLLRNALDAMKGADHKFLAISVAEQGGEVRLSVADSGSGISEDGLAHLFDPFFTTKPAGEGLGLGLSISEGIVRDLGGTLTAANRPQGGAEFTMTLRKVQE